MCTEPVLAPAAVPVFEEMVRREGGGKARLKFDLAPARGELLGQHRVDYAINNPQHGGSQLADTGQHLEQRARSLPALSQSPSPPVASEPSPLPQPAHAILGLVTSFAARPSAQNAAAAFTQAQWNTQVDKLVRDKKRCAKMINEQYSHIAKYEIHLLRVFERLIGREPELQTVSWDEITAAAEDEFRSVLMRTVESFREKNAQIRFGEIIPAAILTVQSYDFEQVFRARHPIPPGATPDLVEEIRLKHKFLAGIQQKGVLRRWFNEYGEDARTPSGIRYRRLEGGVLDYWTGKLEDFVEFDERNRWENTGLTADMLPFVDQRAFGLNVYQPLDDMVTARSVASKGLSVQHRTVQNDQVEQSSDKGSTPLQHVILERMRQEAAQNFSSSIRPELDTEEQEGMQNRALISQVTPVDMDLQVRDTAESQELIQPRRPYIETYVRPQSEAPTAGQSQVRFIASVPPATAVTRPEFSPPRPLASYSSYEANVAQEGAEAVNHVWPPMAGKTVAIALEQQGIPTSGTYCRDVSATPQSAISARAQNTNHEALDQPDSTQFSTPMTAIENTKAQDVTRLPAIEDLSATSIQEPVKTSAMSPGIPAQAQTAQILPDTSTLNATSLQIEPTPSLGSSASQTAAIDTASVNIDKPAPATPGTAASKQACMPCVRGGQTCSGANGDEKCEPCKKLKRNCHPFGSKRPYSRSPEKTNKKRGTTKLVGESAGTKADTEKVDRADEDRGCEQQLSDQPHLRTGSDALDATDQGRGTESLSAVPAQENDCVLPAGPVSAIQTSNDVGTLDDALSVASVTATQASEAPVASVPEPESSLTSMEADSTIHASPAKLVIAATDAKTSGTTVTESVQVQVKAKRVIR
jgi:hypothetical protein